MSTSMNSRFDETVHDFVKSAQALTRLSVGGLEKLSALQLTSLQYYADVVLQQCRDALELRDAEGLRAFLVERNDLVKATGDKAVADAKTLARIGLELHSEGEKLVRESLRSIGGKAA